MQDIYLKSNITKLKKFRKVEFADQIIVEKFIPQIEEIISLFNLKFEEVFISDESLFSDFEDNSIDKQKLKSFKEKYGFTPESNHYLYEISQKMVCKRRK